MTIRFKMLVLGMAAMGATAAFAEQSSAPGSTAANKEPLEQTIKGLAEADKATLERTIKGLDLMGGVGRPRREEDDAPEADFGPDPLGDLSNAMSDVHTDLSKYKTDQPVQQKEKEVVATLDKLIAAMSPKSSGTGNGNTPNGMGRKRSGIFEGDPKFGDMHDVNNQGRNWAQLPPKERERILQSRTEGFPPGFESLLQSYYQRLAQEKAAEEKALDEPKGGGR